MTAMTKFYSPRPLDDDQLAKMVPSIFTQTAHHSRSERFAPIPTITAVRELRRNGFACYGAGESGCRFTDRRNYVKHMLKFRKEGDDSRRMRVGDSTLEVILRNANDGTSGYHLDAGIFRLACLNGMVVKSRDFGSVNIRHTGERRQTLDRVVVGTHEIAQRADLALAAPRDWSRIILDAAQRAAFAEAAHKLRFGDKEDRLEPRQLLIPRRYEDSRGDLWSVFNVVQENCINGGIAAVRNMPGASRRWTTRGVNGIGDNVRLNQNLWELAETFAKEAA
jgi:hypothetical protein